MKGLNRNILILGLVSFFTDISSEMILSVLPLFLTQNLGAGPAFVGIIEGIANATSSLLQLVSGWFSDHIKRRKPLVVLGYFLSNMIKPLLAWTNQWTQVLGIRFTDRIGKGIRTAPRDALVADASATAVRGRAFGFHRAMDTLGAVGGALLAFSILSLHGSYRSIFIGSLFPGLLAIAILFFLKEPVLASKKEEKKKDSLSQEKNKTLHPYLFFFILFTLGNIGYAFALLRANALGIPSRWIPLLYLLYNIVYAGCAFPVGILSDRWGRKKMLLGGIVLNIFLTIGMAMANTVIQMIGLFFLFGLVSALYETVPRILASELVRKEKRGTGMGVYHTVVGLTALFGGIVFGFLWQKWNFQTAFFFSAIVSLLAGIVLMGIPEIESEA